jgi:hypothetical protein
MRKVQTTKKFGSYIKYIHTFKSWHASEKSDGIKVYTFTDRYLIGQML